ncbi:uncharacterized protein MKK02DRAFT_28185 [Dioszegia hungarica]|uniref:Uncharacterized protein n=1 Tax=Dioszegia hungarica TaxID=4972 RepID=A0AA38H5N0_9TREE|nr:uncharacterized protein MKK02DRAFT_28185 [Dioszegia hungarica]KAI9634443.1 hypothetical protein MKK02DRAFT_28185 [Dioszegia hungarica]
MQLHLLLSALFTFLTHSLAWLYQYPPKHVPDQRSPSGAKGPYHPHSRAHSWFETQLASGLKTDCAQTFFILAIPILYEAPHVAKAGSFFLHTAETPPPGFSSFTTEELVKRGFTKYAALKHVRHLSIVDPAYAVSRYNAHDGPIVLRPEPEFITSLKLATPLLESLPPLMMPSLQTVRVVGERFPSYNYFASMRVWEEFFEVLMERMQPRAWCMIPGILLRIATRIIKFSIHSTTPFDLPVLHLHDDIARCLARDFRLACEPLPGSTTYIHLGGERDNSLGDLGPDHYIYGLDGIADQERCKKEILGSADSIQSAKDVEKDQEDGNVDEGDEDDDAWDLPRDRLEDIVDRSRIVITTPLPAGADPSSSAATLGEMQRILMEGLVEGFSCERPTWGWMVRRLQVEVRLHEGEGPACSTYRRTSPPL